MQPHILINKLSRYHVPARLQLWILDFLTNRGQCVRTSLETSSTIHINTGAPQGCVLSAFLFITYTNDMTVNDTTCKVLKYADDTAILGLIDNCDETNYRNTIQAVNDWCKDSYLNLNVNKTKKLYLISAKMSLYQML
jgi:hypothetical protein